uniref:UBR-type domain-containing protein n=1 Tax=Romanomermis culicivorax TaxID=13658 RepID=A0A915KKD1_ROMCU
MSNEENDDNAQEDEQVITLQEFIDEENEEIEEAVRVLGNADDKQCSYSKGYMKRQPLYSCLTCAKSLETDDAGICLACSLVCHDGHDLVELYTKRNFRCDCGNSKFGSSFKCSLEPSKDEINARNKYDQTFRGLYCTCHRPFPDPENSETEDQMIQCIVCEDWFHMNHANVDDAIDCEEIACATCCEKIPFLKCYSMTNWRKELCRCEACTADYKTLDCEYLLEESDSCAFYERESIANHNKRRSETLRLNSGGESSSQSSTNSGDDFQMLANLCGMDKVVQLEMIH